MNEADNNPTYIPILKAKRGEYRALKHLDERLKDSIYPCFEVRTSEQHEALRGNLSSHWPRRAIVDYSSPEGLMAGWRIDAFLHTVSSIPGGELDLVPVINPLDWNFLRQPAVRGALAKCQSCVFRLRIDQKPSTNDILAYCQSALSIFDGPPVAVDLIIDARVTPEIIDRTEVQYISSVVDQLAPLKFRYITLASGAYPIDIEVGTNRFARRDKELWLAVSKSKPKFNLGYGDYTVVSPLWEEDPGMRRGKVAIRYALGADWLVLKGNDSTKDESIRLSQLMLALFPSEFRGETYSFGDKLIGDRADSALPLSQKKGGGETHLLEGVNHHITFVLNEG